ncbi:MAG: hypothetical protein R6X23_13815, partial [Acidimicrobiia bacterium]
MPADRAGRAAPSASMCPGTAARSWASRTSASGAHRDRDLTTWVDPEGAGRLAWRGTPDALVLLAQDRAAVPGHIDADGAARPARSAGT